MTDRPNSILDLADPVRRFVRRRVRDRHVAEDIAQDVLVKVHAHAGDRPVDDHKLPAWAFRIARNAVIDHYRSRRERDQRDAVTVESAVPEPDDRAVVADELGDCLRRMIVRLPAQYREALTLADVEGLNQSEVAARAGISVSGAKSRVQRARQQLKEMLLDCCRVEWDGRGNVLDYERTNRASAYCGDPNRTRQCGR